MEIQFLDSWWIFFKLKFSKFIQNFRTLNVFGKFLFIVKEANSRTHLWNTLLSTYVRYLRRVVKSLWQDYNLVEELPGHPVVPSLLLSVHFPLHNPCPSQVARIFKNFRSATQLSKEADRLTKLLEFHIISEFLKMLSYVLCRKCQFKMSGTQFHNPLFALWGRVMQSFLPNHVRAC